MDSTNRQSAPLIADNITAADARRHLQQRHEEFTSHHYCRYFYDSLSSCGLVVDEIENNRVDSRRSDVRNCSFSIFQTKI
jgi:hypothetical protein